MPDNSTPAFYYDIGSPYAWLVGEAISRHLPNAEWMPVLQSDVDDGPLWDGDDERIFELAQKFDVLRPRFSERMNLTIADTRPMMLAATYTKSIGRVVTFSLAAMRQMFNAGRAVDEEDTIALAGAGTELNPEALKVLSVSDEMIAALDKAGNELRERVGGRTELPLLIATAADGTEIRAVEDDLIALALTEFREITGGEPVER